MAVASAGLALAEPARSQAAQSNAAGNAPIERLRIVIPANEGGGWDQTGRALGAAMLGGGVVSAVDYENIGGKGGTIGLAKYVEKYDADPNALLIGGMVMVGAVALQKPAIDMSRIHALARLTSDYEVVAVKADSPVVTVKDLIGRLRTQPESTAIAGGSSGGVDHMFAGMLARLAGSTSKLVYLPNAGGAQVVEALESGKAVAGISGYSEFSEGIASGKLRAIGVSAKRPFLGIPSAREQGVDADLANWRGVFTGKAVPPKRQQELVALARRAVQTDAWQKTLKRQNWDSSWMEGKDFQGYLELDSAMAGVMTVLLKLKTG
ncbi:tripartite tricarboxylate transporter substrate-binding protein [Variovorax sp. J31P207]|uniref:Bug family tripartite tricarboxylate transporter substrate binding protein n=1 Tax=Variovorax sp. J31P207 TaxID=3053510 RepID=UPI0025788701|nr:tripartite tricarboxylate transporter substrate-binding protein [Variovorax sp. J31P207]MDM0070063.1 tripartite tricarboxylate transporter substrate-binding protein [Variovorax sp. J31P207]